jgi:hypothetical protein
VLDSEVDSAETWLEIEVEMPDTDEFTVEIAVDVTADCELTSVE